MFSEGLEVPSFVILSPFIEGAAQRGPQLAGGRHCWPLSVIYFVVPGASRENGRLAAAVG